MNVTMENVSLEAWNEDGVKLILGDSCILGRPDSRTMSYESSEFLTCWVWMDDLDDLRRVQDRPWTSTRTPSTPPVGKLGEKAILIHLAGYEDWRPRSPGVSFGTSSENRSSASIAVPFTRHARVLNGRQLAAGRQLRPGGTGRRRR